MDNSSTSDPSENAERRLAEWRRSFVPTETAIDGGLFPARLADGMFGFEDYASFRLSGERAEIPELEPEAEAKLARLFGGPIQPKERLIR